MIRIIAFLLAFAGVATAQTIYNSSGASFSPPAITCTNQFIRSIAAATGVGTCATVAAATDVSGLGGYALISAGALINSLGADVNMNNTSNYFDGPSVAQGSTGTWFASGTITANDTGVASIACKLWDGTTIISSAIVTATVATDFITISLSGFLAAPAGNLRISCRDLTATTGKILFNSSGNSKDSTVAAYRIN